MDLLNSTTEIPIIIQVHHFLSSGRQPHQLLMNYPSGTNPCTSLFFCHRGAGEFGHVIPGWWTFNVPDETRRMELVEAAQTHGTELCHAIKIICTLGSQPLAPGDQQDLPLSSMFTFSCSLYGCHPFGSSSSPSSLCGGWSCDRCICWLDSESTGASRKPSLDFSRFWDGLLTPGSAVVLGTAPLCWPTFSPMQISNLGKPWELPNFPIWESPSD